MIDYLTIKLMSDVRYDQVFYQYKSFIINNSCFDSVKAVSYTHLLEAQEFLAARSVDLIFADINMPDLSGVEFVRALPQRDVYKRQL